MTTPEEIQTEDFKKANEEVEQILGATKPKHLGQGLTSGIGYILRGAVGACGAVVLMPAVAAAEGKREAGVLGAIGGGAGGVMAGVVQGANVLAGGIVTGVGQIVRGAAATPSAIVAPSKGMWWNQNDGKWVKTYLLEEERWLKTQPEFDEDILGEDAIPEEERKARKEKESSSTKSDDKRNLVKDMYYYDKLGVDPDVSSDMIKRRYFIIARKFSPDRAGANPKAQQEFQEVGKAYTILMNPDLRTKYDRVGKDKLWAEEEEPPDINPFVLYSMLFGQEKFQDYFGRLAAVTSVRVGDEKHSNITLENARLLQKRRVTRLAVKLADRLAKWAEDGLEDAARDEWQAQADNLCDSSYGPELTHVVGQVYTVAAAQWLGSFDSGMGMPNISAWAKKRRVDIDVSTKKVSQKVTEVGGNKKQLAIQKNVGTAIDKAGGDDELQEVAMDVLRKSHLQETAVDLLWQQTVVDITSTIHEAASMVLNDQNASIDVRKARANALNCCGEIFQNAERSNQLAASEQKELEQVAFHAMLDTVWRQEMNVRQHGHSTA
mmetsp:Transcript_52860/g.128193  ORF Transcript_52860/g.128193 Transcript_52860/m.128193 type:complete len:549 (-) Transcript_52860:1501-3147(-)